MTQARPPLSFRDMRDWDRHEAVRFAVLRYLNGGVDAPKGWVGSGPLYDATAEWWLDERKRLNAIFAS